VGTNLPVASRAGPLSKEAIAYQLAPRLQSSGIGGLKHANIDYSVARWFDDVEFYPYKSKPGWYWEPKAFQPKVQKWAPRLLER
jgi:hypothetical protein